MSPFVCGIRYVGFFCVLDTTDRGRFRQLPVVSSDDAPPIFFLRFGF